MDLEKCEECLKPISGIYDLKEVCCSVRLILTESRKEMRNAYLKIIKADADEVRRLVTERWND